MYYLPIEIVSELLGPIVIIWSTSSVAYKLGLNWSSIICLFLLCLRRLFSLLDRLRLVQHSEGLPADTLLMIAILATVILSLTIILTNTFRLRLILNIPIRLWSFLLIHFYNIVFLVKLKTNRLKFICKIGLYLSLFCYLMTC